MWFKLTVILVGLIVATMYFAGSPDEATQIAETSDPAPIEDAVEDAAEEVPAEVLPETRAAIRRSEPLEQAPRQTANNTPEETPRDAPSDPALDIAAEDALDAARSSLSGLTLEALRLPEDDASAVSLADRVRSRIVEEPVDTSRPSLAPQTALSDVEVIVVEDPAVQAALDSVQASPAPESSTRFAVVTGSEVNLRSGPSTANAVVGRVQAGQRVQLLGETSPGWSSILNPTTGEPVFMSSQFLREGLQ
ncbi:MAG: SH3 domain-containing protein [Pseudomonadota bacterium]